MEKDREEISYAHDDEINLYELLAVMKKRHRLILGIFLIAVILTVAASFILPPVYRVSASLAPGWLEVKDDGTVVPVDSAQNILSSITNGSYNVRIIEILKLSPKEYGKMEFDTTLAKGSDVIHVHYDTEEPEMGISILEELLNQIRGYYSKRIKARKESIEISIQIFQNDIQIIENKKSRILNEKKRILSNMQLNKDKIVLLKKTEESLKKQLTEVDANTKEIMLQRTDLLRQGKDVKDAVALLLYSNTIQQNISYIDRLNSHLDKNQLEQESGKNVLEKMEISLKDKDIELKDMDTHISDAVQEVEKLNIKKNAIEGVRIMQEPVSGFLPVKPNKILNVAIASVGSLFFGVFLSFFLEWVEKGKKLALSRP